MQVNQADLKYVNPAAREAAGGARAALGSDYELQLRSEAGPQPAKLAKRKHQISSLYHHAKIRVWPWHQNTSLLLCYSLQHLHASPLLFMPQLQSYREMHRTALRLWGAPWCYLCLCWKHILQQLACNLCDRVSVPLMSKCPCKAVQY